MVKTVLFDFGGVIAEEGFREGLRQIAEDNGLDPAEFYSTADALIYSTGYLTGSAQEDFYWKNLRKRTGVRGGDQELRSEILKKFIIRPAMLACVDQLRLKGYSVVMLSDQTNWLEEIDETTGLFKHFDRVLNSFRMARSKRDPETFQYVCDLLGKEPKEILFIDDNDGHIRRAATAGIRTIHFTTFEDFQKKMGRLGDNGVCCSP